MEKKLVDKLLAKYKTPFYLFDIDILIKRIEYLKKMIPKNVALCYAMKANPFVIKEVEKFVDKYEVCSYGEYKICESVDIPKKRLVISGVYKNEEEINKMFESEEKIGTFTVESLVQLDLLAKITNKRRESINVIVRLTSGNQFGMQESEIEYILKNRLNYPYINIVGLQYFSGTQKISMKKIGHEIEYIDNYLDYLEKTLGFVAEELEFGAGFPVYYFESETDFDEEKYLYDFASLIRNMHYQGKIILELGRSIVASCGKYFTKVVDAKNNKVGNFAILDGGMNHLVYYGQMMAMKVPKYELYPERRKDNEKEWNLCGSLCTINDILIKKLPVSNLQIGDVFIFQNTGAYSMTEGISLFLSRDLPKIVFLKNNNTLLVRDVLTTYLINTPCYEKEVK